MNTIKKYNIESLENGQALKVLAATIFSSSLISYKKIGAGFYAHAYKISLNKPPYIAVVKCHIYPDRSDAEAQQLKLLRKHSIIKVPEVYAEKAQGPDFPCDAIMMEYIPGINASQIEFPDDCLRQNFVNEVVENLRTWHAVHNEKGFGDIGEKMEKSWPDAYRKKVEGLRDALFLQGKNSLVSPLVMRIIDKSCDKFDKVFENANKQSSLVHSDYNAWNMMVDPKTYKLTGIIDPIDAGWSDPEIDLFHLPNCRPELGLLECYLEKQKVDESFWMRYYFYRFWDDIKHYVRMGWYEEERFVKYGKELENQMHF